MTDRAIVYDPAIAETTDFLKANKFAMLGDAFLAMATLGNSATNPSQVVAGLACTPTSPPSLQVNVGPGAIFQLDEVDATPYSDLGTDTNQIYKMGIREALGTLAITPPGTSGFSQVFLVQAILSDVDTDALVLSYYNSDDPNNPWSGPNNDGASQFTTRSCVCTIGLKAGVAAPTGTQTTPAPDTGFIGLYAITVANGTTQITAGNIAPVNNGFAPFVNTALPYIPAAVQAGGWVYGEDTGAASAAIVTLQGPVPAALVEGMTIRVKMAVAPIGASTLEVMTAAGGVTKSIVTSGATPIARNAWAAGDIVEMSYDGTNWQARGIIVAGQPIYLQAPQTFYVGGTGASDSNDGQSATVSGGHGPWATLQHAANYISQYNLNGHDIAIEVADGSYGPLSLPNMAGSGQVLWNGDSTTPANCTITGNNADAVLGNNCGTAHVLTGFKYVTTGSGSEESNWCTSIGNSNITLSHPEFGASVGGGLLAFGGGEIRLDGPVRVSGAPAGNGFGTSSFANTQVGGSIQVTQFISPATCTITAPMTFSDAFISVSSGNTEILFSSIINPSNVTGQRYKVSLNGVCNTGGGGANYYPGTVAGATASGGQYA